MTGHDADEPTMDEAERGRDALRELGSEPLPADVLARLDGRLEGELGRPAPVRRGRRLPRLALAIPASGAVLAAVVVVAVLATNGGSSNPPQELAASSMRAKSAAPIVPKAGAGGAAADSTAAPSVSGAPVEVPDLVGHGLGYVRTVTRAHGLKWDTFVGTRCTPAPGARVGRQLPAAGTTVPAGTTIRVSLGKCRQAAGSGS